MLRTYNENNGLEKNIVLGLKKKKHERKSYNELARRGQENYWKDYQEYQVCYTRSTKRTKYAIPGEPSMLYQEFQVCYTRTTKYAIPGLPSMLYQEYQVCYTRSTKYAIPGVPSMLYQEYQVCYTRSTKYAIPGEPSMLYQDNQVCYTRRTKYAIPGEPRMFHKENQYVKPAVEIPSYLPAEKIPSGLPVNRNHPSLVCGSICQRRPAARKMVKTPSRYNESIGRDFRH
ncbi:hypothetical protein LAZ67_20000815 [Cordylochernes scorpioides]|uniref:Uncharacterized protein n=1 Tax=Cordylochernes scorpioides TaxID=51811 RepID=A0ABY6LL50_9ARAC|nr:hypothetical protein LAZ67_20000815 [Cordylochernes scorpioides]